MLLLELKLTNLNCNQKDPLRNHHLQYQGTGIHRLQRISVKLIFTKQLWLHYNQEVCNCALVWFLNKSETGIFFQCFNVAVVPKPGLFSVEQFSVPVSKICENWYTKSGDSPIYGKRKVGDLYINLHHHHCEI